ncbi:MAG TPA: energy transducer TonB, partial [Candidatus Angelobacter sp.]|nr:energy transducer TonB [Candidatus Angelobacter sp.]
DDKRKKLVFYEFARHKARVEPPVKEFVPVEIRLNQPLDSAEQVRTVLGRVFALSKTDLLDSLPEFWHGYIRDNFEYGTDNPQGLDKSSSGVKPDRITTGTTDQEQNSSEVLRCCKKDVTAPKPASTPEPEFSEAARYEKFTGVLVLEIVIDKDGTIAHVKIVKPLGLGLDESAVKSVKKWRFIPGAKEGQPVALQMNIEVSFNLY